MALSASVLSADIYARWIADPDAGFITPSHPALTAEQTARIQAMADAVAAAVVSHITTFGVASGTVTVASVSGVTTGPGVSGPGAGTFVGTIS